MRQCACLPILFLLICFFYMVYSTKKFCTVQTLTWPSLAVQTPTYMALHYCTDSYRALPYCTDSYMALPYCTDSYMALPYCTDSYMALPYCRDSYSLTSLSRLLTWKPQVLDMWWISVNRQSFKQLLSVGHVH